MSKKSISINPNFLKLEKLETPKEKKQKRKDLLIL